MSEVIISDIQITPIPPRNGLVGFASCIINDYLYIGSIAIYTAPSAPEGFRLVYPSKSLRSGVKIDICYPINKEVATILQHAVVEKYKEVMEGFIINKGGENNE